MSKSLRIKVLEYLVENHGVDTTTDIKPVFGKLFQTIEDRKIVTDAIEYMVNDGLIECAPSQYTHIRIIQGGVLMPAPYYINARITKDGEQYLRDRGPKQPTYHVQDSQGVVFGNGSHSLRFDKANINSPNINPISTPKAKTWLEKFWLPLSIATISIVLGTIILGIIYGWFPILK